ncbi:MAG: hypothetical protein GX786_02465, partial [Clostridiales bacterium]|nr:hypothetical protein [Clostridiales bacterium]
KPITLYGPRDETSVVFNHVITSPFFQFYEAHPADEIVTSQGKVQVGPTSHPVPGVGYRMDGWVYSGDTNLVEGLEAFVSQASLWLACGCVLNEDWEEEGAHLSAALAGKIAKKANIKKLILTHLKPVVDGETLLKEGQEAFSNTFLAEERKRYQM